MTGFVSTMVSMSFLHWLVISVGPAAFQGSFASFANQSWDLRAVFFYRSIIGTSNKLFLEFASSPAGPLLNTGFDFRLTSNQSHICGKDRKPQWVIAFDRNCYLLSEPKWAWTSIGINGAIWVDFVLENVTTLWIWYWYLFSPAVIVNPSLTTYHRRVTSVPGTGKSALNGSCHQVCGIYVLQLLFTGTLSISGASM